MLRALYRTVLFQSTNRARGFCPLREWLSRQQSAQFDAEGHFDVTGCDRGRRYRIRYGTSTIVHEIDDTGRRGKGWCFLPAGRLVPGDVILAQSGAAKKGRSIR